jgi:hypothetical protein
MSDEPVFRREKAFRGIPRDPAIRTAAQQATFLNTNGRYERPNFYLSGAQPPTSPPVTPPPPPPPARRREPLQLRRTVIAPFVRPQTTPTRVVRMSPEDKRTVSEFAAIMRARLEGGDSDDSIPLPTPHSPDAHTSPTPMSQGPSVPLESENVDPQEVSNASVTHTLVASPSPDTTTMATRPGPQFTFDLAEDEERTECPPPCSTPVPGGNMWEHESDPHAGNRGLWRSIVLEEDVIRQKRDRTAEPRLLTALLDTLYTAQSASQ